MPVNLSTPEASSLRAVAGVRLGIAEAGIRKPGRRDLTVIELAAGSRVAGMFTTNRFCAAPVQVCRAHLAVGEVRALVINTGIANAGTGERGLADARASCDALAAEMGCRSDQVLPFSTGVILEHLPMARLVAGLPKAVAALDADAWHAAAHAIMTTDTIAKAASRQVQVDGVTVTLTGMSKGAGMIRPNMATMLGFLATDARVSQEVLDVLVREATEASFNSITVDGDTSTNDACLLLATGRSGASVPATSDDRARFATAVSELCVELAQAIVRDGEGATKFITVRVEGGRDVAECRQVAYTIAHSPLVKTAFFAADPNWGRILAAVGRSGLDALDLERVTIHLDEVCIIRDGGRAPDYTEEQGQRVMARPEIAIRIELGRGGAAARIWTTDLSFDYVRINAEYRT